MKQIISNLSIITLLTILFLPNKSYSIKSELDSSICLEIKGKISNLGNKSSDTYNVELIYYNTVINNETVNVGKPFKYELKKNAIYTIRISKRGYITKLISLYTTLPAKHNDKYKLDFETELIEEHQSKNLNAEALDFPITIIYYDEKANWFYFNEEYTSNIKRCMYNAKVVKNKL
jgi:hypothetical protein